MNTTNNLFCKPTTTTTSQLKVEFVNTCPSEKNNVSSSYSSPQNSYIMAFMSVPEKNHALVQHKLKMSTLYSVGPNGKYQFLTFVGCKRNKHAKPCFIFLQSRS